MLLIQCINRCLEFIEIALLWVRNTDLPSHPTGCKELLLVRHNDGFKKIAPNTILYIEASRSYCEVHLTGGTSMVVAVPLSEIVSQLSDDNFIRIHRSFSVNLLHIDSFIGNTLVLETGAALPIGREYRKIVLGRFTLVGTKSRKYTP